MATTSPAGAPARVPVIDIGPLRGRDPAARAATVAAIGAACRDVGFLSVTGHGVDPAERDAAFAHSRRFFALPDAVKASVAMDHDGPFAERGYDGIGQQRLDEEAEPDRKESFNIGPPIPADHPLVLDGTPLQGPSRWLPEEELPGFRDAEARYQASLTEVAHLLLGAMAEALDLPATWFDHCLTVPNGALRLVHYPPRRATAGVTEFGAGAHTDWGAVTVLAQDVTGGLQVQTADGDWVDVVPDPDALVVNIGDLLERWTNGIFRSTPHRVLGSTRDRYSIVLFHDVDWYAEVACLPTCTSADRPPRYEPTTCGEHILGKFRASVV